MLLYFLVDSQLTQRNPCHFSGNALLFNSALIRSLLPPPCDQWATSRGKNLSRYPPIWLRATCSHTAESDGKEHKSRQTFKAKHNWGTKHDLFVRLIKFVSFSTNFNLFRHCFLNKIDNERDQARPKILWQGCHCNRYNFNFYRIYLPIFLLLRN